MQERGNQLTTVLQIIMEWNLGPMKTNPSSVGFDFGTSTCKFTAMTSELCHILDFLQNGMGHF